ncbi:MAG TPA: DnaJ domain-containing protein [Pseudonocardiaceae bacterium]|nr:DnaJ domain-containing protein [Pseudonocardiaceae bacterium]
MSEPRHEKPAGDLYAVLGVAPDVDQHELARAYRWRLRQAHPDTRAQHGRTSGPSVDEVLRAYAILRDPARRAEYDRTRATPLPPSADHRDRARTGVSIPVRHRDTPPGHSRWWIRAGPVRRHRS